MSNYRTDLFRLVQRRLEEEYNGRNIVNESKFELGDFSKICRICLSSDSVQSIFHLTYNGNMLKDLINFVLSIEVEENDLLPQNICLKCYSDIIKGAAIREIGQNSDAYLKSLLKSHEEEYYEDTNDELPQETLKETNDENTDNNKTENGFYLVFDDMENMLDADKEIVQNESTVEIAEVEGKQNFTQISPKTNPSDHTYSRINQKQLEKSSSKTKTFEEVYIQQIRESMGYKDNQNIAVKEEKNEKGEDDDPKYVYIENIDDENINDEMEEDNNMSEKDVEFETTAVESEIIEEDFEALQLKLPPGTIGDEQTSSTIWYGCKICGKYFSKMSQLKKHVKKVHTVNDSFYCHICGEEFTDTDLLSNHVQQHSKMENVDENYEMSEEEEKPIKEKGYLCQTCGKMFATSTNLHTHTKTVHNNEKLSCEVCHKSFSSYGNKKLHYSRHHMPEGRPYSCSVCSKSFVTPTDLRAHMQVHSGRKNFTCQVCGKGFRLKTSYNSHQLIHTGERPHQCKICFRRFVQPTHLNYHSLTHTGERPHACMYCGKSFALKGNLTVHIRTHTGERPYVCDICGKGFYDSSSRKKHRKGHNCDDSQLPVLITIDNDDNNES